MLADAIRAEQFRFWKNRTTLLWSTVFVPVMAVVFSAIGIFFTKANEAQLAADPRMPPQVAEMISNPTPINLAIQMTMGAAKLDNPLILLFVLIGVATIYAGDYRWETWRLISARNSRTNLLLGKLAVTALLATMTMGLMLISGIIETVLQAGVFERPLVFEPTVEMFSTFVANVALCWLRILQFTMMAMLAAVVTRSLLAALFVPLVVGVAQFFSPQILGGMGLAPDAWASILANPAAAMDALKMTVFTPQGTPPLPEGLALKSVISLTLWTIAPLAGALFLFNRQDLSKE